MSKSFLYLSIVTLLFFSSCKPSVKPEQLYGRWNYIKFEKTKNYPPLTEPDWKLKLEAPYIEFSKNNDVIMYWGREVFARGKFRTDGNKILFNQVLDGGQTREFPFYVIELTDKQIVFETQGEDAARVTAVRK